MKFTLSKSFAARLCNLLGHKWRYKNYANAVKSNGDKYDFTASRTCTRCKIHSYQYDDWKNTDRSGIDFQGNYIL